MSMFDVREAERNSWSNVTEMIEETYSEVARKSLFLTFSIDEVLA